MADYTAQLNSLIKSYQDSLIVQYKDKPKALATIELYVRAFIEKTKMLEIRDLLNIDKQEGKQLKTIGKIIGITATLNDEDYRILIKLKILKNTLSTYSVFLIQNLLTSFFGTAITVDEAKLSIIYIINQDQINLNIINTIIENNVPPKPMGVKLNIIKKNSDEKIFTFLDKDKAVYSDYEAGWDDAGMVQGTVYLDI